jgi:O-antigen ligase
VPFMLLAALLVLLWGVGGASRADVPGQALSRLFSCLALSALVLFSPRLKLRGARAAAILLSLSAFVALVQLIPLPPSLWPLLPGRELLTEAATIAGQPQPWRPLTVSPDATRNALASLLVPAAVLIMALQLTLEEHWRLVKLLLALILAGCVVALLQFSGARFDNPFINDIAGSVSGTFANRNHFALFAALGCLLAPIWGFRTATKTRWSVLGSLALIPFLILIILATGSRAGIALGALALGAAAIVSRASIRQELESLPRWGIVLVLLVFATLIIGVVTAAIFYDRAASLDRVFAGGSATELRIAAAPYVLDAIVRYFPLGAGFGTFDPVYRMIEPDHLLREAYFNHAHNDWLEVVLDGGIAGLLLLAGACLWLLRATWQAWRWRREGQSLALAGAGILILIMIASIVDYPARTPMVMALAVLAAVWLDLGIRSDPGRTRGPG